MGLVSKALRTSEQILLRRPTVSAELEVRFRTVFGEV